MKQALKENKKQCRAPLGACLFSLIICAATILHSQVVLDRNHLKAIYFQPSYPSASGLGSGAAFIATAEGGEAAEVNPAGLYRLAVRELNVQLRNSIYINHEISPNPTNPSQWSAHRNQVTNLANISFSIPPIKLPFLPFNTAGSIYKYEAINFKNAFFFEQYKPDPLNQRPGSGLNGLITDYRVFLDTWGLSFATRIFGSEDSPNLDAGISFKLLTLAHNLEQEIFDGAGNFGNVPKDLSFITVANSSETKLTAQLGIIYRWKKYRFGVTGNLGRTFTVNTHVFTPARTGSEGETAGAFTFPKLLKIWHPSWLGFGLAANVRQSWQIEGDLVYTWYSNQLDILKPAVKDTNSLIMDNSWRPHVGLTKTFRDREKKEKLKLRLGYYYFSNHRFRTSSSEPAVQLFFAQSEDVHHVTGGIEFGLVTMPSYRLGLAIAGDYSPKFSRKGAIVTAEGANSFDLLISLRLKFL